MPARRTLVVVGVIVAVLAVGALWFFSDGRALSTHRSQWESKEPASYSYDWSHCSGMCEGCSVHVTVEHGEVTDRTPNCSEAALTIDEVFDLVERDRSEETTDSIEVEYDEEWGFPARVDVSCPDGYMDCGAGYSVRNFEALD